MTFSSYKEFYLVIMNYWPLWTSVVENEKSVHIAVFYRPPSSDIIYINKLQNAMSLLYRHGVKRLVLAGDFNVPGIN